MQTKASPKKSEARQKGLTSKKWHGDPATFNQTSFLKKHTGMKTWDLDNPISKLQASEMIKAIKDDDANIPRVTEILSEQFGCVPYVRPKAQAKKAKKQDVDKDAIAKQIADLQALLAS
jgi:hypothetical protein